MKERKIEKFETFTYEGFGFPVILINAPMRKVFGEWVVDINFNKLRNDVLNYLIHKPTGLTGAELRFIRKHFEMTTTEFGKACGVTHAAVLKWESEENRISPTVDVYIRLYILSRLNAKNEEFGKLYHEISLEQLSYKSSREQDPLKIESFA
jgi:DNA-binding transcriptional regulator YiaG